MSFCFRLHEPIFITDDGKGYLMRGGRKTAQQSGINIRTRDVLYERMCEYAEGAFFTIDDICENDSEKQDFIALQGYDQLHVFDQYHTRIVETEKLRRLPTLKSVLEHYCQVRDCKIVKSGDRFAWEEGYKVWEPIKGYRFYTDKKEDTLSLGRIKIKILNAPEWLRDESTDGRMFRCFYDLDPKELNHALRMTLRSHRAEKIDLNSIVEFGKRISPESIPETFVDPGLIVGRILTFINEPHRDAA